MSPDIIWTFVAVAAAFSTVCWGVRPSVEGGNPSRSRHSHHHGHHGRVHESSLAQQHSHQGHHHYVSKHHVGMKSRRAGDRHSTQAPAPRKPPGMSDPSAGFNQEFPHFHVYPSTHRIVKEGAPARLVFVFALRSPAEFLKFVLPPGYKTADRPNDPQGCPFFSGKDDAGHGAGEHHEVNLKMVSDATDVMNKIDRCEVQKAENDISFSLIPKGGIDGLTRFPSAPLEKNYWFSFQINVWFPEKTPEDNVFKLQWMQAGATVNEWQGSLQFPGWPLLGDWSCIYSDWEGWGTCTARCGGGRTAFSRRILEKPPEGSKEKCDEELTKDEACNEHPCQFKCSMDGELQSREHPAQCSAVCGGGVQVVRQKWSGEDCPKKEDMSAVRLLPCGHHPCSARCLHSTNWLAMTECSAQCGEGTFWAIRPITQKESADPACKPIWRKMRCIRQPCGEQGFVISQPDRKILPMVGEEHRVAILFSSFNGHNIGSTEFKLQAPDGYEFVAGDDRACDIKENNLMPYYVSCARGESKNVVSLSFRPPLPSSTDRSSAGNSRSFFEIAIKHPNDCSKTDERIGTQGIGECEQKNNDWTMWLSPAEGESHVESAAGYTLYEVQQEVVAEKFKLQNGENCVGNIALPTPASTAVECLGTGTEKQEDHLHQEGLLLDPACGLKLKVPPTGYGPIKTGGADDTPRCLEGAVAPETASVGKLFLTTCREGAEEQHWWTSSLDGGGKIEWARYQDEDQKWCIGIGDEGGNPGSKRRKAILARCADVQAAWTIPCPGTPRKLNPCKQIADTALSRRYRPQYCSPRIKCDVGCDCQKTRCRCPAQDAP